ncbi:hypothetical protein GBA52_008343 [Prunus armeniaca]|nr:hypothetical protein GBA52_008343 [Prunus armeniaca]
MMHAADMISHLQEIYREGTRNKRFSAVCELLKMKMVKGAPVHQHRLKMIGLTKQLESLNSHWTATWPPISSLRKGKFNVSKKKKWNPKLKPKGGVKKKQEEGRGERIVFPLWERRTLEKELPGLLS